MDSADRRRPETRWSSRIQTALLILIGLVVVGYNLGANSLHNQDEAKHAVVAREAAVDGNWLPLTYNGRPYFNKPPLRIWLTAISFELAGINEWTVRFWSAVSALATALALFLIGRRLYGHRAAFLAALVLLTSHQYLYNHCARSGETDAMLIFFLSSGLLLLEVAIRERRRGALFLAAISIGLCGITKHLGFVPIVLTIVIATILLSRSWTSFPLRTWLLGLTTVFAVALPWHVVVWAFEGDRFLHGYFLREVVERRLEVAAGRQSSARLGHWVSIGTFVKGFFPWSYLLPLGLVTLPFRGRDKSRWTLPVVWLGVILATTVISVQKFTWYVLPAVPAAALLVAGLIDRFLAARALPTTKLALLIAAVAALASTTTAAVLDPFAAMARQSMLSVWTLGRFQGTESQPGVAVLRLLAVAALLSLGYWTLGRLHRGETVRRISRGLLIGAVAAQAFWIAVSPLRFSHQQSTLHQMADIIDDRVGPHTPIYVSLAGRKDVNPLFNFYIGGFDVRRFAPADFDPVAWSGEVLLTDVATLARLHDAPVDLAEGNRILGRARGLLLLRLP